MQETASGVGLCPAHKRKLEVVCVECKERICTNCGLFGKHRQHDIRTEEEVFKQISERADYLIEMYDVLEQQEGYFTDLQDVERLYLSFKTRQMELRKQVETKFKEIKTALKIHETKIHERLDQQFAQLENKFVATRDIPKQLLKEVERWKGETKVLLDELTEHTASPDYIAFQLLESKADKDLVSSGFTLIDKLEHSSAVPSQGELGAAINSVAVLFQPAAVEQVQKVCTVVVNAKDQPPIQLPSKSATPRAAKIINLGQQHGVLASGSSQKSLKPTENIEHSAILDTGLASQDFLDQDQDLLGNMSFGGLQNQLDQSQQPGSSSAQTPCYPNSSEPTEFPPPSKESSFKPKPEEPLSSTQSQETKVPEEETKEVGGAAAAEAAAGAARVVVVDGEAEEVKVSTTNENSPSMKCQLSSEQSPASPDLVRKMLSEKGIVLPTQFGDQAILRTTSEGTNPGQTVDQFIKKVQALAEDQGEQKEDEAVAQLADQEKQEMKEMALVEDLKQEELEGLLAAQAEGEGEGEDEGESEEEESMDINMDELHPSLQELVASGGDTQDLTGQGLGDAGVEQLAMLIKAEVVSLRVLNLSKNEITDKGVKPLMEVIGGSGLQTLNLANNKLTEGSVDSLSRGIRSGSGLKAMVLSGNAISSRLAKNRLKQVSGAGLQIIF